MNANGSVAAIIVTWNCSAAASGCVQSLKSGVLRRPLRIVLADNGSNEPDRAKLGQLRDVELLDLGVNLGFAAACNAAAAQCHEDYLLFLNPDVEALPDSVESMASWLDVHSEAAGVGGHLLKDGRSQFGFMVRRFPSPVQAAAEALMLDEIPGIGSRLRGYGEGHLSMEDASAVEQPAGACLMLRRPVFAAAGGFDERFYPAWFEDVDLCRRLFHQRQQLYFLPQARFTHAGGLSLSQLSWGQFLSSFYRNQRRYFDKHHGVAGELLVRFAVCAGMLLRVALLPFFVDRRAGNRRGAFRAYCGVVRAMF